MVIKDMKMKTFDAPSAVKSGKTPSLDRRDTNKKYLLLVPYLENLSPTDRGP